MKTKDVIEILKNDGCEHCLYQFESPIKCTMDDCEIKIANLIAIEALEKQMPKKPDYEADGYSDGVLVYDTWICPHCGKHYEVDYDDYKYCPECGQALDWSDDNE